MALCQPGNLTWLQSAISIIVIIKTRYALCCSVEAGINLVYGDRRVMKGVYLSVDNIDEEISRGPCVDNWICNNVTFVDQT